MIKDHTGLRRISIFLFFAALVLLVVHIQILSMFNRKELSIHGNDSSSNAYMEIDSRANSTSKWLKRDFQLSDGQTADLTGQTIDETLYNNSGDMIRDWQLRVNIAGDCFINQSWNGMVEIHQFVESGREKVQKLDLQDYALEDVKLEYRYDGDLLIPLEKGDYVLYLPNEHYTEMPVQSGDKVTVGMIFYYLEDLDLSDYDLTVHFHRVFTQGVSFIVFVVAAALWILSQAMYITSIFTYRSAQKQMELRRSSLSYMSALYEAIYIINLPADEISAVSPGEYVETLRAKIHSAGELLHTAVQEDADDPYLEEALAFVDTSTLAGRLEGRESIVYDFVSRKHGWCRIRFFAMEREEGVPLHNVIFAVQDINDERSEVKSLADRLEKAESVTMANRAFLSAASRDLRAPVKELLSMDEHLLAEKDPESVRKSAENIRSIATRMLTLIDGLAERAALEAGKEAVRERYALKQLIREAFSEVRPLAEEKQAGLEVDVSETIPDALLGDAGKLREALVSLLADALNSCTGGKVRLSVFGKAEEETIHLLFSIRTLPENEASGKNFLEPQAEKAIPDLDLEVAASLLAGTGSKLKSVRSPDAWMDRYFETDQHIADSTPVGRFTAEELEA